MILTNHFCQTSQLRDFELQIFDIQTAARTARARQAAQKFSDVDPRIRMFSLQCHAAFLDGFNPQINFALTGFVLQCNNQAAAFWMWRFLNSCGPLTAQVASPRHSLWLQEAAVTNTHLSQDADLKNLKLISA